MSALSCCCLSFLWTNEENTFSEQLCWSLLPPTFRCCFLVPLRLLLSIVSSVSIRIDPQRRHLMHSVGLMRLQFVQFHWSTEAIVPIFQPWTSSSDQGHHNHPFHNTHIRGRCSRAKSDVQRVLWMAINTIFHRDFQNKFSWLATEI